MNINKKRKSYLKKNVLDVLLLIILLVITAFALKAAKGATLVDRLVSDDSSIRREAIKEFKAKGFEEKEKYVHSLIRILKDEGNPSQHLAAYSLSKIGSMSRIALPDLINALKSSNYDVRWNTLHAIADLGSIAKAAKPYLISLLNAENKYERASAAIALVAIDEADGNIDRIVRELISAVNYNDKFTRKRAVTKLGNIGHRAKEAAPTLLEIARRPDQPHRRHALWALGRLGEKNKEIFAVLVSALHDRSSNIWLNAMISIELLFPDAKESVPIIKEHLAHQNAFDNFNSALLFSAFEGDAIDTQILIDLGANVDVKGYYTSKTPLMIAAENGRIDTVKILLKNGADINAKSDGVGVDSRITEPFLSGDMASFLKEIFIPSTDKKQNKNKYEFKTVMECVRESEISMEKKQSIVSLLNDYIQ